MRKDDFLLCHIFQPFVLNIWCVFTIEDIDNLVFLLPAKCMAEEESKYTNTSCFLEWKVFLDSLLKDSCETAMHITAVGTHQEFSDTQCWNPVRLAPETVVGDQRR